MVEEDDKPELTPGTLHQRSPCAACGQPLADKHRAAYCGCGEGVVALGEVKLVEVTVVRADAVQVPQRSKGFCPKEEVFPLRHR